MIRKLLSALSHAFDDSLFVVRIEKGRVSLTKGRIPPRFLSEVAEFAKSVGLRRGVIRGRREKTYTRIVFSKDIPSVVHQRLRNIWHVHEPAFRTNS